MAESANGLKIQGYLRDVVEVSILQEVLDKFAKATGVAALLVDIDGINITYPSNFTSFCKLVRSTPEGLKGCYKSDETGGKLACEKQNISLYTCHSGLTDMAAPLIVEGVYWGAVLCGQVLLEKPSQEKLSQCRTFARRIGVDEENLVQAMRKIEVVTEDKIRAAGELLQIVANYIVTMSVSKLVQQKLTQQLEESAKKERVMYQLELRALQSQVNPHFLFNTLNAASRLALIEGAGKTEEMIHALSRLLRYTLRNIDQIVPLQEELDYIRDYLFIQKTRYGDHIDVEIDADPAVMNVIIPVMTLQPVVENAIIHGLEPKEESGKIIITTKVVGECIRIQIRDTGLGMDLKESRLILDNIRSGLGHGHTTGLGLSNVHKRLQHCFGEGYGLELSSTPGKGTLVEVLIPVRGRITNESEVET